MDAVILAKAMPVELRASATHGLGVFATTNIAKGEKCVFYPNHVEVTEAGEGLLIDRSALEKYGQAAVMLAVNKYCLRLSDGAGSVCSYVGLPAKVEGGALGHMINDGASFHDGRRYAAKSEQRQNVTFRYLTKNWAVGIATKDIAAGEELFLSYGAAYWNDEAKEAS